MLLGSRPPSICIPPLGWRCRSSPRKRREVKRTDTRIPVPVPDPSLLIPFADPHNLNARRRLPDSTESTSVPVVRLARVAVLEQHPLDGVLQLSSPAWMGSTRGAVPTLSASPTSHFVSNEEKYEKPLEKPHPQRHGKRLDEEAEPCPGRKSGRPPTSWNVNDLLHNCC